MLSYEQDLAASIYYSHLSLWALRAHFIDLSIIVHLDQAISAAQ